MTSYWFFLQAAALLSSQEVNWLFGALAGLWATVLAVGGVLYKIGSAWVAKVNTKIESLETELAKVPTWVRDALDVHEAKDNERHEVQMQAIQKNADVMTATSAEVQLNHAVLKERFENSEDDRRHNERRKK